MGDYETNVDKTPGEGYTPSDLSGDFLTDLGWIREVTQAGGITVEEACARAGWGADYIRRIMAEMEGQQSAFDLSSVPDAKRQGVQDVADFLDRLREQEKDETLRKAALYSSTDLLVIGQTLLTFYGVPAGEQDQRSALQMGIAFYLLGKVGRIIGALEAGTEVTADTWFDAHVYGMMGLKVHETGRWT